MRQFALALSFLFAVGTAALANEAPIELEGATTINANDVIEMVQKLDKLVILDNRSVADYEAGHIEGAVRLMDTDLTSEEVLAKVVPTKETPVIFYCNGMKCGRAAKAAAKALGWGYVNVYYYSLGMSEWKERALPITN